MLIVISERRGLLKEFVVKSEVKALEWAASALVAKLDMLFVIDGAGLLDVRHGLHITTPDHLRHESHAFVTIYPIGWPKECYINANFFRGAFGWELYEAGTIEFFSQKIRFKPSDSPIGLRLDPRDDQKSLMRIGYRRLIQALQKDLREF